MNNPIASAHVFYDDYLSLQELDHPSTCSEMRWRKRLLDSPNGHLLRKNAFFDALNKQTIWLAHITSNLDKIIESKSLYPSGGCLVGSIYCVPAYKHKDGSFSMHNLGNWVYFEEAPIAVDKESLKALEVILFEIKRPATLHGRPIGIDYTRLGSFHFDIYSELKYLLTRQERQELEGQVVDRLKSAVGFLSEVERLADQDELTLKEARDFIDQFAKYVPILPVLGYLYFESLVEYVLYYQDDDVAGQYKKKGEFYNYYYKMIAKDIKKDLYKKFQLSSFAASAQKLLSIVRSYSDRGLIFRSFDETHFLRFTAERSIFRIHSYLKNGHDMPNRSLMNWDFNAVAETFSPLLGHVIHRELRNFSRFPDFYHYFDQTKALKVWNYWNNHDIVIPFNGILPKGEVGINPAYIDNTAYTIYRTKMMNSEGKLEIVQELDARISSRLVDMKHTLMRHRK